MNNLEPTAFFKCLADETRLKTLLLIMHQQELCVCELVAALALSQPKISRHLALLRKSGLLSDRKQSQWVYYQLNSDLPNWAQQILKATLDSNFQLIDTDLIRLETMGNRPERQAHCC
ncbi:MULTISPECIES: metalloregulator ArsR/SmtB family transcription factor [Pseudoalteromonas]|uniref:metalloregulator ArsR/SmtB family transcription factor n=1 Tax=Pseudoalteromonas TaxID=53246 RepID=UPI0015F85F95|nr:MULTISPECIES: metalloregulator ArsR/SmtB family transcription factor [Pseudoalteromonas]QMW16207.1 metalloregulator ArsR/SmtB family transcription factor [Pseudoalteromonas sp. MT33b]|tara:strand:+ start:623 stop:976 length:354 start_codon:yes stop_codon:yes gene_type:complete